MVVDRLEPGVGRHRIVVPSGSHLWREWLARGGSLGCGSGASRATDCIRRRKALASAKSGGGKIEPFTIAHEFRVVSQGSPGSTQKLALASRCCTYRFAALNQNLLFSPLAGVAVDRRHLLQTTLP